MILETFDFYILKIFIFFYIKSKIDLNSMRLIDEYFSNSCKQFYNTCVNIGKDRWIKFENLIHFQEMSYFVDYLTWQCLDTHARVTILANFMRRRCEILFGMLFNFCHILFLGKKCFAVSAFVYFVQFSHCKDWASLVQCRDSNFSQIINAQCTL